MTRSLPVARVLLAVLALLVTACGGGDGDSREPAATVAQPTREPTASEPVLTPGVSGVPELDAVVAAIRSGDAQAIEDLVRLTTFECSTESGLPPPPLCPEGQPDGSPVERFPSTSCETAMLTSEEMDEIAGSIAEGRVYGVYDALDAGFFGETHLVILTAGEAGQIGSSAVGVVDGAIVSKRSSCPPLAPEDYVESLGLGSRVPAQ